MPDVQEVFRMATQKVRPDPGAMERQDRHQRQRRTRQRAGGYALLAILMIAAVVIGVIATRPREERPAGQGEREAPTTAELATKPYFLDLDTGQATLLPKSLEGGYSYVASPDGTKLAYFGDEPGSLIKIANLDGTVVRTIRPPEGFEDQLPRWSPDGTRIVYVEREAGSQDDVGNIFVFDLSTGEKTQITDLELTHAYTYDLSPSFSQSGDDSVVFHMPRSSAVETKWDVWTVPATGGEPELLLPDAYFAMTNPSPPGPDLYAIQFLEPSADGPAGRSIMTGHPETNRRTLVEANTNEGIWSPTMSPDGNRIAYQEGGSIYVLEIATRETRMVAEGNTAEWLGNDTLIVAP
jgi:Tol biopolymer transport system component